MQLALFSKQAGQAHVSDVLLHFFMAVQTMVQYIL
jgi:hypothetical protein